MPSGRMTGGEAKHQSISLMETAVSILRDKFGWKRKKATLLVTLYVLILGTIVSLGFGPLSFIQIIGLGLLGKMK